MKFSVALLRKPRDSASEVAASRARELRPARLERGPRLRRAAEEPAVQERGVQLNVLVVKGEALAYVSDRVAQPETGVPQILHKTADGNATRCRVHPVRQKYQDIDIGMGKQFSPAEAADGENRRSRKRRGQMDVPRLHHPRADGLRALANARQCFVWC